jgi:holo-[acyl-carrier protein] synthase
LIIGLGSDLADIRRIEATLERFGERFVSRIFTDVERARSERKADRAASYAKRFAAKEACAKALGTGLRAGVFWRDMGVVNARSGAPTLTLTGGAAKRLAAITPPGLSPHIHLTLTDDHPYALAVVIIEALAPMSAS